MGRHDTALAWVAGLGVALSPALMLLWYVVCAAVIG